MCHGWIKYCREGFEFRDKIKFKLLKESWLHNGLMYLFFGLKCITLRTLLEAYCKRCRKNYKFVEIYVLGWLIIEFVSLFRASKDLNTGFLVLIVGLVGLRLLDILQSWFNQLIFDFRPELALSAARTLILSLIGLLEVALIFGVLQLIWSTSFKNDSCEIITSKAQAFYNSIRIITTMGPEYGPVDGWGYTLFFGEVAMGVIFLVVVVQLVLAHLTRR